jgi:3-oxoacyl-[acyl-carrier-protein] synthase-3
MRFQHVCLEALCYRLPDEVVTSEAIEEQLADVYERLGLPAGRLELMTGIRQRRFFAPGTRPGEISARTARDAIEASGIDPGRFGVLVHGSVCRDQLEPATASGVHAASGLPADTMILDVSNACLGLLNGCLLLANMIELGQVQAGVVVGTEIGRELVEGTIDSLINDTALTRQTIKPAFASLTIGSGSAAIVLCDRRLSQTGHRLLGGVVRCDTAAHQLCAGGVSTEDHGDDRPRMETDSEALLHAGIELAAATWAETREVLGWSNDCVDKAFTHQVGKAHRNMLYQRLGLDPAIDYSTVEFLGNTGATALPIAAAMGQEAGHLEPGDRVAWLGIGSGLSSVMLGFQW